MNEILQNQLVIALKDINGLSLGAIEILQKQFPELMKQLIIYITVNSCITMLCCFIILFAVIIFTKCLFKKIKNDYIKYNEKDDIGQLTINSILGVVTGILVLIVSILFVNSLITIIMIKFTPYIVVLKYLINLN